MLPKALKGRTSKGGPHMQHKVVWVCVVFEGCGGNVLAKPREKKAGPEKAHVLISEANPKTKPQGRKKATESDLRGLIQPKKEPQFTSLRSPLACNLRGEKDFPRSSVEGEESPIRENASRYGTVARMDNVSPTSSIVAKREEKKNDRPKASRVAQHEENRGEILGTGAPYQRRKGRTAGKARKMERKYRGLAATRCKSIKRWGGKSPSLLLSGGEGGGKTRGGEGEKNKPWIGQLSRGPYGQRKKKNFPQL